jgi:hypothetical protein
VLNHSCFSGEPHGHGRLYALGKPFGASQISPIGSFDGALYAICPLLFCDLRRTAIADSPRPAHYPVMAGTAGCLHNCDAAAALFPGLATLQHIGHC